jgi:hypothetical protein
VLEAAGKSGRWAEAPLLVDEAHRTDVVAGLFNHGGLAGTEERVAEILPAGVTRSGELPVALIDCF